MDTVARIFFLLAVMLGPCAVSAFIYRFLIRAIRGTYPPLTTDMLIASFWSCWMSIGISVGHGLGLVPAGYGVYLFISSSSRDLQTAAWNFAIWVLTTVLCVWTRSAVKELAAVDQGSAS